MKYKSIYNPALNIATLESKPSWHRLKVHTLMQNTKQKQPSINAYLGARYSRSADSNNGTKTATEDGQVGSYNSYAQGKCVQIDGDGGGVNVGVCRCEPPAPKKACNVTCSNDSECSTGKCYKTSGSSTGKCRNSKCTSETDCTCPTTVASCGDGVKNQSSEECDVGVACTDATEVCNTTTCLCEAVPDQCGDTCEVDADCPDNTVCNGDTVTDDRYPDQMCILTACTDSNTDCSTDGCRVIPPVTPDELPSTAIINKQADWVIGGIIALLTGGILLKFDVVGGTKRTIKSLARRLQTGGFAYLTAPVSNEAKSELTDKKKRSLEEKIVKGR